MMLMYSCTIFSLKTRFELKLLPSMMCSTIYFKTLYDVDKADDEVDKSIRQVVDVIVKPIS